MAVIEQTPISNFTGNGVTTVFAFDFLVPLNTDLLVIVDGVTQALGTDYTVAGTGVSSGGTVTFTTAPGSGVAVSVVRNIPATRSTDYQENGDLLADVLNDDFDRIVLMVQDATAVVGVRAVRGPVGESLTDLPPSASRANTTLGFDADGQPTVLTPASGSAADVLTRLADDADAAKGAALVAYNPDVAYASKLGAFLNRTWGRTAAEIAAGVTPTDYSYVPGHVRRYGALGTGTDNDRQAFINAFACSKTVYANDGTYWMGAWATSSRILDLTLAGEGLTFVTSGNVWMTCTTSVDGVTPYFFYCRDNDHGRFGHINFKDNNYSRALLRGAGAYCFDVNTASWSDFKIDSLYCENIIQAVTTTTQSSYRFSGLHIGLMVLYECFYGLNSQNQGDGVVIDLMHAERCVRAFFVYGVTGHRANIFTRNNYGTTGAVNISRNVGGLNTSDIEVRYTSRDNTLDLYHVNINHIDLLGGEISGIKLHLDIEGATAYDALRFVNYTGSGGSETSAASANVVYDVEVWGSCDAQARPVDVVASYASKLRMTFHPGRYFDPTADLLAAFSFNYATRGAAPTWTAAGTAPVIGNGSINQDVDIVDGLCTVTTNLTFGTTTTPGTLDWSFSLPFAAITDANGAAFLSDNGTAYFVGVVRVVAGASTAQVYADNQATACRSNTPFTWTTSDRLSFTLTYPIS